MTGLRVDQARETTATDRAANRADRGEGDVRPADAHRECVSRLRRALADMDNVRKRHGRELERTRMSACTALAGQWLPIIDSLEAALTRADADPDSIVAGVRAVRDQAVEVMSRLGFARHDETGVPFDPTRHEVVTVVDAPDVDPGTVVGVIRPGYGDGGHQLRPEAVAVSRRE